MKNLTILLLSLLLLVSCKIDTEKITERHESLKVFIYEYGRPSYEYTLSQSDEKYHKLMLWIKNNQYGWSPTPATYVPRVLISSKTFSVNFIGESVVINYADGQFIKKVDQNEYEFIQK